MTTSGTLKGVWIVGLFMIAGFSCNDSNAQVSVYTSPDSDAIVFDSPTQPTIVVIPKYGTSTVTIPSTYGDSTYYVSPGGYVSPSYEVDDQ